MKVTLRPPAVSDTEICGRIVYEAFKDIAERHGFSAIFSSVEAATRVAKLFIDLPAIHSLVAEADGRVTGAVFLDEGDEIRSIGLIAVDPAAQGRGIGRRLIEDALDRARGAAGVRLVRVSYNTLAMALYASLGFEV